jgi:hypothetical protein
LSTNSSDPLPCSVAASVVNSEPHTGARSSVRLCVRPGLARCVHIYIYLFFATCIFNMLLPFRSGGVSILKACTMSSNQSLRHRARRVSECYLRKSIVLK